MLEALRALIKARAPGATETISYAIPKFDLNGKSKTDHNFHYLHYRSFTVNFGLPELPLNWAFNTDHDGPPESPARITRERRGKAAEGKSSSPAADDDSQ